MAQIQKLIQENQKLKYQLEKLKSSNGLLPYIDDSVIKGSYHVVKDISERDSIDCCYRKLGMKVLVIGNDLSFKEYRLLSTDCNSNVWEEINKADINALNLKQSDITSWRNILGLQNVATQFTIGQITTTNSTITLNLHSSGTNSVVIGNQVYSKSTSDTFNFTPVVSGIKVLKVYALPDSQIFYLEEGNEGTEAVEPTIPNNAIEISIIIVDSNNITVDPGLPAQLLAFAKKDASNVSTYSISWRAALDLYSKSQIDLKNSEQDDRLTNIEGDNISQYDLINDLNSELDSERVRNDAQDSRLDNLEGINYTWSPTNRTLTLYDNNGIQLSQVSLVSLDNEGTDIRYNASTLSLELYNADNELLDSIPVSSFIGSVGTQLQLNSNQLQLKDSQGNILSTVSFSIVNIQGLQTALDSRLNKGSYPGNASDLKNEIDGKLNKPTLISDGNVPKWNSTENNFVGGSIHNKDDGKIGISKTNPDEMLDVNGNVKGVNIKDQYGSLKSQRTITITGDTTLSEIHNGAVLNVTNTCNITIPPVLDANFQCVIFAKGSIIVTFVNGGVTVYAPSGLLLKTDKMASLISTSANNFNLTGELATS